MSNKVVSGIKRKWGEVGCIADRVIKRTRNVSLDTSSPNDINLNTSKSKLKPIAKLKDISAPKNTNWNEWISATKTRNYMLNDPICDWLSEHHNSTTRGLTSGTGSSNGSSKTFTQPQEPRSSSSFTKYIMDQGIEFESHVLVLLMEKLGADMVKQIGGELNCRSPSKIQETFDAMMLGVPVIHSGLLHNPKTKTFGIPDLIVRSDWLHKIVDLAPYTIDEQTISASRLRDVHHAKTAPNYHYVIIDIKFSTLDLRSDGVHLLNSSSYPAYKSQLHIYNEALALIQGYKPDKAFILGRKWCFSKNGVKNKGKSCFDRLGCINYQSKDSKYIQKTSEALKWIQDVRSPEAKDWNISKTPFERKELYPNMSNYHDFPWRGVKENIAAENKEITSLWMMGVKNREIAHSKGIYEWTDPKCNVETLGVGENSHFTKRVLDAILDINKPKYTKKGKLIENKRKVEPLRITNNEGGWQDPQKLEFFVDFETVNDVVTDFSDLPEVKSTTLISMIGVGYICPTAGTWVYKNFTVDKLSLLDEEQICINFVNYIEQEAKLYKVKSPKCIHWAPAEHTFWKGAVDRHYPKSKKWDTSGKKWGWFDLLQVFRQEPIVIEGCLGFGLKAVSSALKKHGCISTGWDSGSSCLDGQGAIIGAWKAHCQAQSQRISMKNTPLMREIAKYNESDVKVLYEIITYLRENHI